MTYQLYFCSCLIAVLLLNSVVAQYSTWSSLPDTGYRALTTDYSGQVLSASTSPDFYYSVDGGANWKNTTIPATAEEFYSVASNADTGNYVLGIGLNGAFVSSNYGEQFTQINSFSLYAAMSASGEVMVMAGSMNPNACLTLSSDFGHNFTANLGPTESITAGCSGVAISADGTTVVLSVTGSGLWVSTSPLTTSSWVQTFPTAVTIMAIAFGGSNFYAGLYGSPYTVLLSTDGANTWSEQSNAVYNVGQIAVDASGTKILLATTSDYGIFYSDNSGLTLDLKSYAAYVVALDGNASLAMWGGSFGVQYSTDIGSVGPTVRPSRSPIVMPIISLQPAAAPTLAPSVLPFFAPTTRPSTAPSAAPTISSAPHTPETVVPSPIPSTAPTNTPTIFPTLSPTTAPVTMSPTASPTKFFPTNPTYAIFSYYNDSTCSTVTAMTSWVTNTCLQASNGEYFSFTCGSGNTIVNNGFSDANCSISTGILNTFSLNLCSDNGNPASENYNMYMEAVSCGSSNPFYSYSTGLVVQTYFDADNCSNDVVIANGYVGNTCLEETPMSSFLVDWSSMSKLDYSGSSTCSVTPHNVTLTTTCSTFSVLMYGFESHYTWQQIQATPTTDSGGGSGGGMSTGVMAGIVVGAAAGVTVAAVGAYLYLYRKKPALGTQKDTDEFHNI